MIALQQQYLVRRQKLAERFLTTPREFKVCDCCQSIWKVTATGCHLCGSYRWRTSEAEVVAIAKIICATPFPFTAGVVPRLNI